MTADEYRPKSSRPRAEILDPGEGALRPLATPPPGFIKHALGVALHYRLQGRSAAAYRLAAREVRLATQELTELDYAIIDRKVAQLILENFDDLVADPEIDLLHTRKADAAKGRIDAEDRLYETKLTSQQRRAAADARHKEVMGQFEKPTAPPSSSQPPGDGLSGLSREQYELAQKLKARAKAATAEKSFELTPENIRATAEIVIADDIARKGPDLSEERRAEHAAIRKAAEETIKDLGLAVIHL